MWYCCVFVLPFGVIKNNNNVIIMVVISAVLSFSSTEARPMSEVVQVCLCVHFPLMNVI